MYWTSQERRCCSSRLLLSSSCHPHQYLLFSLVIVACVQLHPAKCDSEDGKNRTSAMARLHEDIQMRSNDYSLRRMLRPVFSEDTSMTVRIVVKLSNIVSFELDGNKATTQMSMCISWLARTPGGWDPKDYNGISNITLHSYEMWRPDIEVFNHVRFPKTFTENSFFVVLDSSGIAEWCPAGTLVVNCDTDMSHFPHDEHECTLLIGSATYNLDRLKLEPQLIRDDDSDKPSQKKKSPFSSNWDLHDVDFKLIRGVDEVDYFDYVCKLTLRVRRRFSLHSYAFTLALFICAGLTLVFCWLPMSDDKRFQLALLSIILNIYLMVRYSETLQHSTETPWGLRFAGDLILFTCCMIVLQILCLALEDVLMPFATHPIVDRFLSTTVISTLVLNDRLGLLHEDEQNPSVGQTTASAAATDANSSDESGPFRGTNHQQPESRITAETTVISAVNEKWRNLLVAVMRISVTVFLLGYAFIYYVLSTSLVF